MGFIFCDGHTHLNSFVLFFNLSLKLKIILKQRHPVYTSTAIKTISPHLRQQLRRFISPDEAFSSPIHSQLANVIVIGLRGGVQRYYIVMMVHSYQLAHCSPATSDKTSSFSQHFPKAQSQDRKIALPFPNSRCKDKNIWSQTENK